jgi:hypothetical protein
MIGGEWKRAGGAFAQHRYAMVLHTHQQHPHVHLVMKAENELGRRSQGSRADAVGERPPFREPR